MLDRTTGSVVDLLPVVAEEADDRAFRVGSVTRQNRFGKPRRGVLVLIDKDDRESVGDERPEFLIAE
jgi:hypothetical protein